MYVCMYVERQAIIVNNPNLFCSSSGSGWGSGWVVQFTTMDGTSSSAPYVAKCTQVIAQPNLSPSSSQRHAQPSQV